jgi:hypothetical protein
MLIVNIIQKLSWFFLFWIFSFKTGNQENIEGNERLKKEVQDERKRDGVWVGTSRKSMSTWKT